MDTLQDPPACTRDYVSIGPASGPPPRRAGTSTYQLTGILLALSGPLFEFSTPGTETAAPINEWNAPTDVRPTVGGTEPSQLFCCWDPDHHQRAKQALKRAEAAIPKLVPELSQDVHKGKFDDIL